jgi:hypothetical protein
LAYPGGYAYITGGRAMTTDDAYVEADKVGISTDVSGIVDQVAVTENQRVATGQVLDPVTPGEIRRVMVPLGLSVRALARELSVLANRITETINGTPSITAATAILLAAASGSFCTEVGYDLAVAEPLGG